MNSAFRHDLLAVVAACLVWLIFVLTGAGAWGLFIPLLIASVLIPGVLTALLDGPVATRPFVGSIPSVIAAACVLLFSHNDWAALIWQSMIGGAAVIFFVSLVIRRRNARAA